MSRFSEPSAAKPSGRPEPDEDAPLSLVHRPPRQLLLALLGENLVDQPDRPVRAGAFIAALEPCGVTGPAIRVALNRLVHTEVLVRHRRGREISFSLTDSGVDLLTQAVERVRRPRIILVDKVGWTLCTFSVPERQRALRHRVRSILTWAGFAPVRDGFWLAPGAVDLSAPLRLVKDQLPEGSLLAFHAREFPDFPIDQAVRQAWDIDAIRSDHEVFCSTWAQSVTALRAGSPLATMTTLVADWLALLRSDPGLPKEYMGKDFALPRSVEIYERLREELGPPARAEFEDLCAGRQRPPSGRAGEPWRLERTGSAAAAD